MGYSLQVEQLGFVKGFRLGLAENGNRVAIRSAINGFEGYHTMKWGD